MRWGIRHQIMVFCFPPRQKSQNSPVPSHEGFNQSVARKCAKLGFPTYELFPHHIFQFSNRGLRCPIENDISPVSPEFILSPNPRKPFLGAMLVPLRGVSKN